MKKRSLVFIGFGCAVGLLAVCVCAYVVFILYLGSGGSAVKDVSARQAPDGRVLIYQQLGEPFLMGSADVQLVLKDKDGQILSQVKAEISDDGHCAEPGNIKSVEWKEDAVIVTLQASEMPDREIVLKSGGSK